MRQRVSGTLELFEDNSLCHRIHLWEGLVSHVETAGVPLGQHLRQLPSMDALRSAEIVRRLSKLPASLLGCELVELGLVTRAELQLALAGQARQRLDSLFLLKDARIRFRPLAFRVQPRAQLRAQDFLRGRPRRRDLREPRTAEAEPGLSSVHRRRTEALALLGLTGNVGRAEITAAFRRRAARVHPDRNVAAGGSEAQQCGAEFARLSAAYHTLLG